MSYFLLTLKHGDDGYPIVERYEDGADAMEKFAAAERLHRDRADGMGVVLLVADDEETLRRTHSHYFMTAAELLDAARAAS